MTWAVLIAALLAWLGPPSPGASPPSADAGASDDANVAELAMEDAASVSDDALSLDALDISVFDGLDELGVTALGLVVFVVLGVVLFAAFAGLRWLLSLVPMSKARRAALARVRPVVEAGLALVYLFVAIPLMFKGQSSVILTVIFFGLFALMWLPIRDYISGMLIKAGAHCSVGDRVSVDELSGVVKKLGYRVLTLESDEGAEVFVPYSALSRRSIVRTRRVEGLHRHSFDVELPDGNDPVAGIARVKQLAMSSHWASIVREPEVEALDREGVRVHVFALGREHGPAIEAKVRSGLRERG